jgi:hypothetical protein
MGNCARCTWRLSLLLLHVLRACMHSLHYGLPLVIRVSGVVEISALESFSAFAIMADCGSYNLYP